MTDDIQDLAQEAYDIYYYTEFGPMLDYIAELDKEDPSDDPFEDKLADAISSDVRDLLHNGNAEELWSEDHMTDEEIEARADRFHNNFDDLAALSLAIAKIMIKEHN